MLSNTVGPGGHEFDFTEERLWRGAKWIPRNDGRGALWFRGLRHYIRRIRNRAVYIVAAQCYGAYYADRLRQLAETQRPGETQVFVTGCAYGETNLIFKFGSGETVSKIDDRSVCLHAFYLSPPSLSLCRSSSLYCLCYCLFPSLQIHPLPLS